MSASIYDTEEHKELRRICRRAKHRVEATLRDALFKENHELYRHIGADGDLDAAIEFVYEGSLGWRVTLQLRYDGTMPMRITDDVERPGLIPVAERSRPYVRECRNACAMDAAGETDKQWADENAYQWLETNLP